MNERMDETAPHAGGIGLAAPPAAAGRAAGARADNGPPVIELDGFGFQYRSQQEPTLHDITLTIAAGEKVLIVGPSGSGKSTLAHCLNGLAPHVHSGEMTGRARVCGRELAGLGILELSRLIGTVLQDSDGQFVGMTVGEDIAFELENRAVPQTEMRERVERAARAVGMEAHLGASPQTLSGGQKQRVSMAGVLVSDTPVLLFDEPLASLDPEAGRQAVERIDAIHRETGKTIVIVEHRLEEVLHRPVDRIVVFADGRIVADLPPAELLSSPLLAETGLREPLYVTALRHAGCAISPELHPESLERLELASIREPLRDWHEAAPSDPPPPRRSPVLELEDVQFAYDDEGPAVLSGLSLQLGEGELLAVAGHNGAGKSTLARLICGFYRPTSGRILHRGRDLAGDTIKERSERIGFVMQNPNHMLSKTLLYDEVALGLRLRGVPEDEARERVLETLRICGLHPFRSWPVSALSYGQKKRVTIASILVLDPDILLLDEPTAGQDYRHYNEMMEFVLQLKERGKSILVITHDMHLMMEYAERTVVIGDGRVLADAPPATILTDAELVRRASLRETSLQRLAERAGIGAPAEFVGRFIRRDREGRGR
ncbi:ABC transporter ATP-binding protein [Paenibacillus pasadenensis]|uniref:Duplicated ATPase component MtsB of energizing module of methionine-regulated ECF transporter n=1 Tax=Paenibacillus pasadenensis TaxID=217090 RepID=A0A2N5N0J2_9BACL|nr:ABC transporter ATP-binding protein [Paenibacillus pasadenensis]PLT43854.1 Duplicated ATPase component MtsB of energizing module of methionine-regulated ECF transporter [Paenibacillus pasadenensis]